MLLAEKPYFTVCDQLSVMDGVLLFKSRFIIPKELRTQVMALAHEGHPGREVFRDSLRERVWWPGLAKDAALFFRMIFSVLAKASQCTSGAFAYRD